MYYTIEHPDGANTCFDQCVATSPSMEPGSWTDHGSMIFLSRPLSLPVTEAAVFHMLGWMEICF